MAGPPIVLDTNVLVAALRSRRGSSYRLLSLVDAGFFEINVSVPLVLEYEDVLSRPELRLSPEDARDAVDYLCTIGNRHQIHFLWRPYLDDPKDDMVLELAVTAGCRYIVTFNERDFRDIERFGLQAIRPIEFLRIIGVVP
jgi:putative PIN family toxin of toxin-antitoxin system